jgi:WD40 repeat protein/S-adenosylhomocysteine hydrolase
MRSEKQQRRSRHGKEPLRENKPFSSRVGRKVSSDVREPVNPVQMSPQTLSSSATQVPNDLPYVLVGLREKFQGKVDFRHTAFICVQHSMQTTAAMFQVLKDLGARHLFDMGKLYSSSEQGVAALRVLLNKWERFKVKEFRSEEKFGKKALKLKEDILFNIGEKWYFFDQELKKRFDLNEGVSRTEVDRKLYEGIQRRISEFKISVPEDVVTRLIPHIGRTRYLEHDPEIIKYPKGEGEKVQAGEFREFSEICTLAVSKMVDEFKTHLENLPEGEIKNIVVLDDGGTVIGRIASESDKQGRFCGYPVGAVEQTTAGFRDVIEQFVDQKENRPEELKVPVVGVSASAAKSIFEPSFIADAVFESILAQFSQLKGDEKLSIGIIGCGPIGASVVKKILELHKGHEIFVYDRSEDKQRKLAEENIGVGVCRSLEDLVYKGKDIIFGSSGNDVTKEKEQLRLIDVFNDQGLPHLLHYKLRRTLVSCSSENKEFFTLIQYCFAHPEIAEIRILRRQVEHAGKVTEDAIPDLEIELKNCVISIPRSGYPINFSPYYSEKYQRILCSVPKGKIQCIVGCLLGGMIQAHELTKVLKEEPMRKGRGNLYLLLPEFQSLAVKYWLEDNTRDRDTESRDQFSLEEFSIFIDRQRIELLSLYQHQKDKHTGITYGCSVDEVMSQEQKERLGIGVYTTAAAKCSGCFEAIDVFKCSSDRKQLIQKLKDEARRNKEVHYIFPANRPEYTDLGALTFHVYQARGETHKETQFAEFFAGNRRCVYIEGVAGIGKTRLAQHVYYEWAEERLWKDQFDFVVLIKMGDLKTSNYEKDEPISLIDIIDKEYRRMNSGQRLEKLEHLRDFIRGNQERILIILDGCDELPLTQDSPFYHAIIEELLSSRYSVLFTARPGRLPEVYNRFPDYKMEGFKKEDVAQYVEKYFDQKAQEIIQEVLAFIENHMSMSKLVEIPLCLELICIGWEEIKRKWIRRKPGKSKKNREMTSFDLYHLIFGYILQRYSEKYLVDTCELDRIVLNYENHLRQLAFENLGSPIFIVELGEELQKIGFLTNAGMDQTGRNLYQFVHSSFHEYYVVAYLIDALEQFTDGAQLADEDNPFNQYFLSEYPAIVLLLSECIKGDQKKIDRFFRIVKASAEHSNLVKAASNAITVLNVANVCFSGIDLRGIRIPNANLEGAVLDRTNLKGAILSGVRFNNACLGNTQLQGSDLSNIEFGELPFLQHDSEVLSVSYSKDGQKFGVVCLDGTVFVYDMKAGQVWRFLSENVKGTISVAFSPDEKTVAFGSYDENVYLCDIKGKAVKILRGHTGNVNGVDFSPDGEMVVSGSSDETVRLWCVKSGKELRIFSGHTRGVYRVIFSPNGKMILSNSDDGTARLWDVESGVVLQVLHFQKSYIQSIAFTPDGRTIGSGHNDGMVCLWDVASGMVLRFSHEHTDGVERVVFSSDGKMMVSGGDDGTVRLWDVGSWTILNILRGYRGSINSVALNRDGKTIVSGCKYGMVRLWDVENREKLKMSGRYVDYFNSVAFSFDSKMVAIGSNDTVRLWDVESGTEQKVFHGDKAWFDGVVAFSPDGETIVSGWHDGVLRLWDVKSGKERKILWGHTMGIYSVSSNSDGTSLVSGSEDGTVRLWDVESGKTRRVFRHGDVVRSVVFSPDEEMIASASHDRTVCLWCVESGKKLKVFNGHKKWVCSIAFSPCGEMIASGSEDDTIRLWWIDSGKVRRVLRGHESCVTHVVFDPNGEMIASGSADDTVRLWSVESGVCLEVFYVPIQEICGLDWSKDGQWLITGCKDYAVRLWKLSDTEEGRFRPRLQLQWTTWPTLFCQGANITGAQGLSSNNKRLLEQHRAIGEPECIVTDQEQEAWVGIYSTVDDTEYSFPEELGDYSDDDTEYIFAGEPSDYLEQEVSEIKPQFVVESYDEASALSTELSLQEQSQTNPHTDVETVNPSQEDIQLHYALDVSRGDIPQSTESAAHDFDPFEYEELPDEIETDEDSFENDDGSENKGELSHAESEETVQPGCASASTEVPFASNPNILFNGNHASLIDVKNLTEEEQLTLAIEMS